MSRMYTTVSPNANSDESIDVVGFWRRTKSAWANGVLDSLDLSSREEGSGDKSIYSFMDSTPKVMVALQTLRPRNTEILYGYSDGCFVLTNQRLMVFDKISGAYDVYELTDIQRVESKAFWNASMTVVCVDGTSRTYRGLSGGVEDEYMIFALAKASSPQPVAMPGSADPDSQTERDSGSECSPTLSSDAKDAILGGRWQGWKNVILRLGGCPLTFAQKYVEYKNVAINYVDVAEVTHGTSWTGVGVIPVASTDGALAVITGDNGQSICLSGSNMTLLTFQYGSNKTMRQGIIPLIQNRILPVLLRKYAYKIDCSIDPVQVTDCQPRMSKAGLHWQGRSLPWSDLVAIRTVAPASIYQYRHNTTIKSFYYDRSECPVQTTTSASALAESEAAIVAGGPEGGYPNQSIFMPLLRASWEKYAQPGSVLWADDEMWSKN